MFDKRCVCARFQELRILVLVAQQAIANNIVFRFFVIVYADKGFISTDFFNSKFLKFLFIGYSFFFATYSYLPWMTSTTIADNYPENTVKGRICLGLRLDWDKDNSKETSDVYLKPRLIVIACFLFIVPHALPFHCQSKAFHARILCGTELFCSHWGKTKKKSPYFQGTNNLPFADFVLSHS